MLMVISPAKKLDYDSKVNIKNVSQPRFMSQSQALVDILVGMAPHQLSELMHISDQLGELNHDRYQKWSQPFNENNSRVALRAFKGDVYVGLDAESFNDDELAFAQQHLRILSGLYGVLRPLDLMQAYRLEMGTKLANPKGKDLYGFWDTVITESINDDLVASGSKVLLNLASNEYFKSVKKPLLDATLITPVFKDKKAGKYKIISFYAKKARGLMAAYIIKNRITDIEQLKSFNAESYQYNPELSSDTQWVFTRDQE